MLYRIRHKLIIILFSLLLIAGHRAANADQNDITIVSIMPGIYNDSLAVSLNISQLFSPKSLSTLQSGIQSLIEIDIELLKHSGESSLISGSTTVDRFEIYRSLSYNIWDEKYYVNEKGGKRTFNNIDEFKKYACSLANHPLTLLSSLEQTAMYSLRIMVQFFPISEEQSGKVEAWLSNPNQTKFTLASDENSNRFSLSSGKLVSMFLGKKNRPENTSDWYNSKVISYKSLMEK